MVACLDPMPNKGTLKDAKNDTRCKKTGKKNLIQWAYEVRLKTPVSTVNPPSSEDERQAEVDQMAYEHAINEHDGGDAVAFEDIVHTDALAKESGVQIQETDGRDTAFIDESSSDDDDDAYSVVSDEEE
jgi:hypothetical protein